VLQQCAPEGSLRQKRGSTYRYAPYPKGRGQADLRRGKAGTSPQHRTKSPICHKVKPRISDDRALKVVGAYPGRPHVSRWELPLENNRNTGKTGEIKSQALIGQRALSIDEPYSIRRGTQSEGAEAGRASSERTARGVYRIWGVSRGHSISWVGITR